MPAQQNEPGTPAIGRDPQSAAIADHRDTVMMNELGSVANFRRRTRGTMPTSRQIAIWNSLAMRTI